MEISLKTRNKTTTWPAIPLLGIYPEEAKTEKDTCIPLFIAAIYSSQDTKAAQMPIDRRMDKEAVVHLDDGILLSHKKGTRLSQF